jgi:hypothetical protein
MFKQDTEWASFMLPLNVKTFPTFDRIRKFSQIIGRGFYFVDLIMSNMF